MASGGLADRIGRMDKDEALRDLCHAAFFIVRILSKNKRHRLGSMPISEGHSPWMECPALPKNELRVRGGMSTRRQSAAAPAI